MEQDKEKKNEISPQIEPMDNMPQSEPISQNVVEDKFIPAEEHVETPYVATKSLDDSIKPVNKSNTEIPPIPIVPVLGEMKDDMYSMKNNTRKKRKMQKNKTTKKKRRCRKGSRRNKKTRRCRKNKKRV